MKRKPDTEQNIQHLLLNGHDGAKRICLTDIILISAAGKLYRNSY